MPVDFNKLSQLCIRLFSHKNILPFLYITLILSLIAPPQVIYSQSSNETGLPLVKSFSAEEYQAHNQNWAIAQDNRGVMYFGNTIGALEYDGNSWRLHPFPSIVRSMDTDDAGRIYIGAQGDFGYLKPDSTGTNQFISLIGLLSEADREFTNVWKTYATNGVVYFNTLSHLFRWKNDSISIWYPGDTSFGWSFIVRDTLYIQKRGVGIYRMLSDSLELVPGTEKVAQESIYFMLPFDDSKILIGTRTRGLEILEKGEITRFETEIDAFIQENRVYTAKTLSDGSIAIGTQGGLIIISDKGKFIKVVTDAEGLLDKGVLCLFTDQQDQLWIGLQAGICRLDWPSPLTNYGPESGIERHIEVVMRHNDTMFVAGRSGLFYLQPSHINNGQIKNSRFKSIKDFEGLECGAIISFKEKLIIGSYNGIYEYENGVTKHIGCEGTTITCLYRSKQDPDRLFAGGPRIFTSFRLSNDSWMDEGKVNGIIGDIRPILEQGDGKLWLGTRYGGPFRVDFSKGRTKDPVIEQFDASFGIPEGDVYPFAVGDRIIFATDSGIYRFDNYNTNFIPDTTLGELFVGKAHGKEVYRIAVEDSGNVWISTSPHLGMQINQQDGTFHWETAPYMKVKPSVNSIFTDKNSVTWFGGTGGIYRYDQNVYNKNQTDYYTLVRRVMVNTDSLIFNGNPSTSIIPILDYKQNDLSFEFSATDFVDESGIQYQYFLQGYDRKWSSWTTEKRKEYTNLSKGDYTFHIKARNIYDQISKEGKYTFTILPPWWNTWLAKIAYLLLAFILLRGFVRWREAKLRKRQKELEMDIATATMEIRTQKEEVESQRDEIESQRDQLEIQRDIVLAQKNEIVDSINYAQRIQSAMLPPETYVSELVNENFILFKPRDIVSGDFYWIKQVNQYIVLVAADCTGHGVPGALMSMLGISHLNEIVHRREITQANQILNELRKRIKFALRQHGQPDEAKDGIDMALCVMDLKSMKMQYAGANNPLYLIKDVEGRPELKEIKADRMPLGYYQGKDISFVNHDIQLEMGDTFYMFTDGFVDQKGGKDNKKFMSKNFKNLLLEIHDHPMYDQKAILDKTLSDWIANKSQMDDILVMGVRV